MSGWGVSCQGKNTGGCLQKRHININYLELKAAFLALQSFCSKRNSITVLMHLDNITAITFIYRMGGERVTLTYCQTWHHKSIQLNITIYAEHLPVGKNIQADWQSHHHVDSSNWKLYWGIFLALAKKLGPFSIDLDECTAPSILQLEGRLGSSISRCSIYYL